MEHEARNPSELSGGAGCFEITTNRSQPVARVTPRRLSFIGVQEQRKESDTCRRGMRPKEENVVKPGRQREARRTGTCIIHLPEPSSYLKAQEMSQKGKSRRTEKNVVRKCKCGCLDTV